MERQNLHTHGSFYESSSRALSYARRDDEERSSGRLSFSFAWPQRRPLCREESLGFGRRGEEGAGKGTRRETERDCVRVGRGVSDLGISAAGSFAEHKAVCRT